MKYKNINEETLKNTVARDFFYDFICDAVINNIDFTVQIKHETCLAERYLLWAEVKAHASNPVEMLTQLILTIGKSRIIDDIQPPPFLGCFDCKQIVFVEYSDIMEIFYLNDFNWNVTPSNTGTKEFKLVYEKLEELFAGKKYVFDIDRDEVELRTFIKQNLVIGKTDINRIQINKNNFKWVYDKWAIEVKPTIELYNWEKAKAINILDADFYLADLLSSENQTLKDKIFVVLKETKYIMDRHINEMGFIRSDEVSFKDNQKAHTQFWQKYERPPKSEYWDYIIERRDLLVPQDIRERKGSFFTPQVWVELSQKYIADVFGENWQNEYYVWDCAAGTGNLLAGLTNKYNILTSTLDKADVAIMHDRIKNGASLLEHHVFQFDFLNDNFEKLPEGLRKIIKNEPEKLIVYINPPYAEASTRHTVVSTKENKSNVSNSEIYNQFNKIVGTGVRELYIQFFIRIYKEIPNSKLCSFSTLKYVSAVNLEKFRLLFKAEFMKGFVVPANTFDNVGGKFPIGFLIWDLSIKKDICGAEVNAFDKHGSYVSTKNFYTYRKNGFVIDWLRQFYDKKEEKIAFLRMLGTDMQHNPDIFITNKLSDNDLKKTLFTHITKNNIIPMCMYNTIRHVIDNTWLNDRDQFLYPNDGWKEDTIFQTDCLTYTLFHGSNNIQARYGVNHWIPFTESEVEARTKFNSSFMTDFIAGKTKSEFNGKFDFNIGSVTRHDTITSVRSNMGQAQGLPLQFSPRAVEVFKAGKELWKYYHATPPTKNRSEIDSTSWNVNASFYEIREYFQGRDAAGRMKSMSDDEKYNKLVGNLKLEMKFLALQIEPKIYEYGFLTK